MNKDNMQQIFENYIDKFSLINNAKNNENYKWFIAKEFRPLMDKALSSDDDKFADALYQVKKCSANIIDNYVQPFNGLVEFAKQEPSTVRQMFRDLYTDDGGDLYFQEKLIGDFYLKSEELRNKYAANSFLYEQNSHAISAYLFLYDPDNHYLYKANQSKRFADCIEFYEPLGTGIDVKLDAYYKMCDWVQNQIMGSKELLDVDATRFEANNADEMYKDENKHILVFDLIYCCDVYDLFYDIPFVAKSSKEKKEYLAYQATAKKLYDDYSKAQKEDQLLQEALETLDSVISKGTKITHNKFGTGEVTEYKDRLLTVSFNNGIEKRLDAVTLFANGLATLNNMENNEQIIKYAPVLKRKKSIQDALIYAEHALEPYQEYLD